MWNVEVGSGMFTWPCISDLFDFIHTHTRAHTRTHARTHARTHTHTHAHHAHAKQLGSEGGLGKGTDSEFRASLERLFHSLDRAVLERGGGVYDAGTAGVRSQKCPYSLSWWVGYKELYQHKCLSRQREKICTEFLQLQETNTVCVCGTMIFVKDLQHKCLSRQREKICTEFLQLQETNTVCVCGTMIFVKDLSDDAVALLRIFLLLLSFFLNLFFYFFNLNTSLGLLIKYSGQEDWTVTAAWKN